MTTASLSLSLFLVSISLSLLFPTSESMSCKLGQGKEGETKSWFPRWGNTYSGNEQKKSRKNRKSDDDPLPLVAPLSFSLEHFFSLEYFFSQPLETVPSQSLEEGGERRKEDTNHNLFSSIFLVANEILMMQFFSCSLFLASSSTNSSLEGLREGEKVQNFGKFSSLKKWKEKLLLPSNMLEQIFLPLSLLFHSLSLSLWLSDSPSLSIFLIAILTSSIEATGTWKRGRMWMEWKLNFISFSSSICSLSLSGNERWEYERERERRKEREMRTCEQGAWNSWPEASSRFFPLLQKSRVKILDRDSRFLLSLSLFRLPLPLFLSPSYFSYKLYFLVLSTFYERIFLVREGKRRSRRRRRGRERIEESQVDKKILHVHEVRDEESEWWTFERKKWNERQKDRRKKGHLSFLFPASRQLLTIK